MAYYFIIIMHSAFMALYYLYYCF